MLQNAVPAQTSRAPAPPPLRACLLSGGESRRMGRDKALLPHPEGGTWLERTLGLLGQLQLPITLLSRHPRHRALARAWADGVTGVGTAGAAALEAIAEPPPWEGPLLALHRLLERHPDERLLLCPVDMPALTAAALETLRSAADAEPGLILLAHDGCRPQPLLGVYPAPPALRRHLAAAVAGGERRLQTWLVAHPHRIVPLDPRVARNVNRPEEMPWAAATARRGDPAAPQPSSRQARP
ncbi:MAG: molybdenum cofactor guanylyltransferase [Cyanobacteriota bacterium]|nr:molybdenum cofactor guanylyltransferase [Cyanobacteriota bacterium]